jgi:hypothetical protein
LRSEGKPVSKEKLIRILSAKSAAEERRIRQSITVNIHNQKLVLSGNKIGLPEWKDAEVEGRKKNRV